jgi:uncharacterized protein (TIGR02118 family)
MHMLAFVYPSAPGHHFDVDHWRNVHLPLGLGLTDKYLGVRPRRIVLMGPGDGGGGTTEPPFAAIAAVLFDTRDDVETFSTLFEHEEAARRLSQDFPNYAAGPPAIFISEISEVNNVDEMIDIFKSSEL